MNKVKPHALVLFSGGLDSLLAAKIIQSQKIAVTAVIFKSYFWETDKAEKTATNNHLPRFVYDFADEHLTMVKKPPHGYGKAANPCLDCHLLMLKKAKEMLFAPPRRRVAKVKPHLRGDYDFVATGEVLGERPFSQNKKSMEIIAKESGLEGLLLRPLSAKLLPPSIPEKKGLVDREKLYDIQGRSRHRQINLAKKFNITDYPQPAGGCLLCEKVFGEKLKTMFTKWPNCTGADIQLLKLGRHFWESSKLIILGRNESENRRLENLVKPNDRLIIPDYPGPSALIRDDNINQVIITQAQNLIRKYSKSPPQQPQFVVKSG